MDQLRYAALRRRLGFDVGADELIQAALDAVLAGVDGLTLAQLAGLGRREEPDAYDLFDQVVDELGLRADLPADVVEARWSLVRWWCRMVVDGDVAPEVGGSWVWRDAWEALGHPEELQPLVGAVDDWEEWSPAWGVTREAVRDEIVAAAREIAALPWPLPRP